MRKFYLSFLMGGVLLTSFPISAQSVNSIDARLDRMEREMQTLSRSVFKGDVAPPKNLISGNGSSAISNSNVAAMELRMNQMDDQLRRLTGMIEENGYRLRQMEETIKNGSMANNAPATSNTMPMNANNGTSALVVDNEPYQLGTLSNQNTNTTTPAGLYDQAFSYMQSKDYNSAQTAFERFLNEYSDHSLAANAKYWLAETHYARGNYKAASQAFARSFKDHPDGQKAPDTLLKLAMSLQAQDMNQEACLTLGELQNRFPNAQTSVSEKAKEESQAYGCGA